MQTDIELRQIVGVSNYEKQIKRKTIFHNQESEIHWLSDTRQQVV